MPMRNPKDFGAEDITNVYCGHCTHNDGSLKNYADVFQGMVNFVVQTQGLDRSQAEKAAKSGMARMPAWKNHH